MDPQHNGLVAIATRNPPRLLPHLLQSRRSVSCWDNVESQVPVTLLSFSAPPCLWPRLLWPPEGQRRPQVRRAGPHQARQAKRCVVQRRLMSQLALCETSAHQAWPVGCCVVKEKLSTVFLPFPPYHIWRHHCRLILICLLIHFLHLCLIVPICLHRTTVTATFMEVVTPPMLDKVVWLMLSTLSAYHHHRCS